MNDFNTDNPLFLQALDAIDAGDTTALAHLINEHPWLVQNRLQNGEDGYFKDPYLLWFVADNPIRVGKLPGNIVELTGALTQAVKHHSPDTYQYQIGYALILVASGRIPYECGVQIKMIDLLVDAGASPEGLMAALANRNIEAATHLVSRGGKPTLALSVCLEHKEDIDSLAAVAGEDEKVTALAAAAYYGNEAMVKYLLNLNFNPNGFPSAGSGFHGHATPLHQAVSSGSLACVKLLVEAGARIDVTDNMFDGTPLGWADYLRRDSTDEARQNDFLAIENYLRALK